MKLVTEREKEELSLKIGETEAPWLGEKEKKREKRIIP